MQSTYHLPTDFTPEKDEKSFTPLMLTIMRGERANMMKLLEEGADIEAKSLLGSTAVMFTVYTQIGVLYLETLVEKGAKLDHRNWAGLSIFAYAAWNDRLILIESLVDKAKFQPTKVDVHNALCLAAANNHYRIIFFVLERFGHLVGSNDEILAITIIRILILNLILDLCAEH